MESPQPKKRNDKCDEINSGTTENKMIFEHKEEIDTLDNENKVNNLESNETNLNLDILEKWMVKIFPQKKLNFLKLSNYSEDDNISNDATYARLIIIFILITHSGGLITRGGSGMILWTYSNINSVTL